ncbi:S-ribosylhomocysteine lyase [Timonella senegalensis]|uniref:S-ribosylhomocysteine lyase n=1 Tax=Timonella senegalensis TaxID=1465825 RepID=UPI00030BD737|nr:S-ribosylhomocysteine lyase [Timonella senegalensis]
MTKKVVVESFELDHEAVVAPYIRKAGDREIPGGGRVCKYDLRFTQPNTEPHMPIETAHSIEHILAFTLREFSDDIIGVSPMGCLTGMYVITTGVIDTPEKMKDIVIPGLGRLLEFDAVPGAESAKSCGTYLLHDLEGAKQRARAFLAKESELLDVYGHGLAE